jgi:hypothetical protein
MLKAEAIPPFLLGISNDSSVHDINPIRLTPSEFETVLYFSEILAIFPKLV